MREAELKRQEKEFIEEVVSESPQWVKERRLDYLRSRKTKYQAREEELKTLFWDNPGHWMMLFVNEALKEATHPVRAIEAEIQLYERPEYQPDKITDEMIERARNFPIDKIIEVGKNGFAVCPFHNDKNPSAYTNKNYLYCFSCHAQADTIKLFMHLHNVKFKQAVIALNR